MKRQVSENTEPSVKEQRLDADTVFYAGDNHTSPSSSVATRNTHSNMSCKTAVTQVSIYQTNLYLWPSTLTANQIGAQLCFCETTKRFLSCTEEENSKTSPQVVISQIIFSHYSHMKMMNTLCIILSHHILCFTARGSSCSSDTLDDGYLLGDT